MNDQLSDLLESSLLQNDSQNAFCKISAGVPEAAAELVEKCDLLFDVLMGALLCLRMRYLRAVKLITEARSIHFRWCKKYTR